MEILLILIVIAVCAALGYSITTDPEKKAMGAVIGGMLGPLGVLIVAVMNR